MTAGTQGNQGAVYARAFYLLYPTGTTADIAVTFTTNSPTSTQNHIAVYTVVGGTYSSKGGAQSTDMDSTAPLTTGSITIPTDGGFIAVAAKATDTVRATWANATEDLDVDAGGFGFTTATRTTALTTTAVTCTGTTNGEDGAMSWIIFGANTSPTVALNSPADTASTGDLTPTLNFTGTDTNSDVVEYEVQVDLNNTFDSQGGGNYTVSDFEDNTTDGWSSGSVVGSAANGTTYALQFDNPAGGDTTITNGAISGGTTANGYTGISLWFKQGTASVILSGDASALYIDQGGWRYVSLYNYINRASTSWQYITIPFNEFTANGDSTPGVPGTGTVFDKTSSAGAIGLRFWNSSAYSWFVDEMFLYNVGTPLVDALSASDAGFTAGHPFASGAAKDYTVQSSLTASTLYYWRARAIDPSGSNNYGAWSTARSFTATAGGGTVVQDLIGGGFIPFAR